MYKKIALGLTILATAGLLMAGCAREGDTKLREYMYEQVSKLPWESFNVDVGKNDSHTVTLSTSWRDRSSLTVKIRNNETWDKLELTDKAIEGNFLNHGFLRGVDFAEYNGHPNGLEGMDERFDETLRMVKPYLEEAVKAEAKKAKEEEESIRAEVEKAKEATKIN